MPGALPLCTAPAQMRLLLVEDNRDLSQLLITALGASGYRVDAAASASQAMDALAARRYSVVVLDLGLPDQDGLTVLRSMRKRSDVTPVLVLTARSGVQDRVKSLRAGADDYVVKPFDTEELVARLEAILRRQRNLTGNTLRSGDVTLDTESGQLTVGDSAMFLPPREFSLLEILMRHSGRVVTKRRVEDQLFGLAAAIGSNAVEVYVHRLRKLLVDAGANIEIHTVRGVGYLVSEKK